MKKNNKISEAFSDTDKITELLQAEIYAALLKHKKLGNPICEGKDGQVVWIAPDDIHVYEKDGKLVWISPDDKK